MKFVNKCDSIFVTFVCTKFLTLEYTLQGLLVTYSFAFDTYYRITRDASPVEKKNKRKSKSNKSVPAKKQKRSGKANNKTNTKASSKVSSKVKPNVNDTSDTESTQTGNSSTGTDIESEKSIFESTDSEYGFGF